MLGRSKRENENQPRFRLEMSNRHQTQSTECENRVDKMNSCICVFLRASRELNLVYQISSYPLMQIRQCLQSTAYH